MLDMFFTLATIQEIYPMIEKFDRTMLLSSIGMLVDMWAYDHGLDSVTTCQMLEDLCIIQKEVHSELGGAV